MELEFSLRANPVVTRDGKRHDVLMDVKFQAKGSEVAGAELEQKRQDAARNWLIAQGTKHGFELIQEESLMTDEPFYQLDINGYQQNVLKGPNHEKPVLYSTVDFSGVLRITDIALFREALKKGFGKSKAFGCGLLLLKKR